MRILLLLSGGLDSVTLAAKLVRDGHEVLGLFVDRGQSNVEREREAVGYFKKELNLPVRETSLRDWRRSWQRPDGVADKELPRNAMFVLAALPFARDFKADEIALGSNVDDTAVPDGSPAFLKAMNDLLAATDQPERLIAPYLKENMNKVAVARLALKFLGEDNVAHTWTCWTGRSSPCEECPACRGRIAALDEARRTAGTK